MNYNANASPFLFVPLSLFDCPVIFVLFLIPLLVPNWASAEAQFIPNFSLHTKFHCKFSLHNVHFHCTLYIFIANCTFSLHILYCCSSSCGTLTAEPLLSNSRVALEKQIVINIIINQNPSTLSTGRNTN